MPGNRSSTHELGPRTPSLDHAPTHSGARRIAPAVLVVGVWGEDGVSDPTRVGAREALERSSFPDDPLKALLARPLRLPDADPLPQVVAGDVEFRLMATQTGADEYCIRGQITRRRGAGVFIQDHVAGAWFPKRFVRRWDVNYVWVSAWIVRYRDLQIVGEYIAPEPRELPRFDAYDGDGGYHG